MIPNISSKYKCIFVHIPKTAGTSIEAKLGFYQGNPNDFDHRPIRQIKQSISPDIFDSYFKFAVVRNPWDRAVSWYRSDKNIPKEVSFLDFLQGIKSNPYHLMHSCQYDFLAIYDKIAVDKVCVFENLEEDWVEICRILNFGATKLSKINVSWKSWLLPPQKSRNYTDFYGVQERKIVESLYGKDIEFFGYKYGE